MILTAVLSSAGAIALLLIWRYTSVARGARKRDEALSSRLAPLEGSVSSGISAERKAGGSSPGLLAAAPE